MKVVDIRADRYNLSYKLMPDDERNRDGASRPLVPVINMLVGSADAGHQHADQDIVDAEFGSRNFFHPQPNFRSALYERLHFAPSVHENTKHTTVVLGLSLRSVLVSGPSSPDRLGTPDCASRHRCPAAAAGRRAGFRSGSVDHRWPRSRVAPSRRSARWEL